MAFCSTCTWDCYCKTWNPTPSTTTPSAPVTPPPHPPPKKKKKKNHMHAHIHTHSQKPRNKQFALSLPPVCLCVCGCFFFLLRRGGRVLFCARTHWWLIWLINYNNKRKLSFMNAISWACESCKKMIYPQLPASIKSLAVKSLPHSPTYYPNLQIVN